MSNKKRLAIRLLNIVFSIYLIITVFITAIQMYFQYKQEQTNVKNALATTEFIFFESLSTASWNFDGIQLAASLDGLLKMPKVIGVKIDNIEKPADWQQAFPIRLGKVLDEQNNIIPNSHPTYLKLITHTFELKKDDLILGHVTLYSSNTVVFDAVKYNFLAIIIAAIIKTIVLWLLFIWAFNSFLGKKLNVFCETMDHADIDNPETTFLSLKTDNIEELSRIEKAFNHLFQRVLQRKQQLDELNKTLEQKVLERTQALEDANAKLLELSTTDSLTGLANRRYFDELLIKECDRANNSKSPFALFMIDVDDFKKYNDYYGHQAGDHCLINVAKLLKINERNSGDLTARYGGEEFAFIAPKTNKNNAIHLAKQLCNEIFNQKQPHQLSSFGIVTISIGIALYQTGETPETLIKKADKALYYAKRNGRNQAVFYNQNLDF